MGKRVLIILFLNFLLFVGTAQNPQGFFLDDWQPKTVVSPPYVNTPQPTDPTTVTVTVDMNDTITKISKYIYGNNTINWAGKMNNRTGLVKDINNLQSSVLRWPGGNLSNEHFWYAVENDGPTDIPPTMEIGPLNAGMTTANWAMNLNDYYDLRAKTNTEGSICINYSYARYGTGSDPVANAAHYAANWVRYDNGRTKFWEIGNENMGSWQAGYEIDTTLNQDGQPQFISGELYGQHSRVFIDSMKSAASEIGTEIKIGVVLMDKNVNYNDIMKNWNKGVLSNVADLADFMIVHSYYTPYNQNSNVATILNSAEHTQDYKDFVLHDLKTYGGLNTLPVALTEWNIFAQGSKQSVSYINGIHVTLVLGELIKNEYGESTRWDLINGWNNGDDHGLFASSKEPGVISDTPHAPFYYMYYFQKYFGDHLVESTVTGNNDIVTYASSFSTGQSGIVLVNKGIEKQIVSLQIDNMSDAKSYYRFVLTGGTDNGDFSRKVYVNGEGTNLEGGGPSNYGTLEAYGKSIFGDIKVEAPPLSVTYVLVTSDLIPPTTGVGTLMKSTFKVYPNPTENEITVDSPDFKFDKIEIINLNGQKVFEQIFESVERNSAKLNFNLNKGIYVLNLYRHNQNISKKLVVK